MNNEALANCQITMTNWQHNKKALCNIRKAVFIEEQKVPEELEWDEYDNSAIHFMASIQGEAVATARLKNDGQIGRMAVLHEFRNKSIGSQLLRFILQAAITKNINPIFLHAQVQVIPFYKKHGFTEEGETFMDANILHCKMVLTTT